MFKRFNAADSNSKHKSCNNCGMHIQKIATERRSDGYHWHVWQCWNCERTDIYNVDTGVTEHHINYTPRKSESDDTQGIAFKGDGLQFLMTIKADKLVINLHGNNSIPTLIPMKEVIDNTTCVWIVERNIGHLQFGLSCGAVLNYVVDGYNDTQSVVNYLHIKSYIEI